MDLRTGALPEHQQEQRQPRQQQNQEQDGHLQQAEECLFDRPEEDNLAAVIQEAVQSLDSHFNQQEQPQQPPSSLEEDHQDLLHQILFHIHQIRNLLESQMAQSTNNHDNQEMPDIDQQDLNQNLPSW